MKVNTFPISFQLPLLGAGTMVPLTAIAEEHHSEEHYIIRSIQPEIKHLPLKSGRWQSLCFIEIKPKNVEGQKLWVHCGSEKESPLSNFVGAAIDKALNR